MPAGNRTYEGLAVPIKGESTITQKNAGADILTIEGVANQTGDFLVARTSAGTEKFSVEVDGDVVVAGTGTINGGVSIACKGNGDNVSTYAANGDIAVTDNAVILSKPTASAMTLAAPGAGNFPKFVTIVTSTAQAHVITVAGLSGGNTLTFVAAIGNSVTLKAISATVWVVAGLNGVTLSTM